MFRLMLASVSMLICGAAFAQNSFGEAQTGAMGQSMGQPMGQPMGVQPSQDFGGQVRGIAPPGAVPGGQELGYGGRAPEYGGQQPGYAGQPPGLPAQPDYAGQGTGFDQPHPQYGQQPQPVAPQGSGQGYAQGQPPVAQQPAPSSGLDPRFLEFLDQLAQYERQDFGVTPVQQLHGGAMHGPTPASIPGGQLVTTRGLVELVQGRQATYLLFDVLGAQEMMPGAIPAVPASAPGQFGDQISGQMGAFLQQVTQGNREMPMIFYCASRECWMSYNAALRAINLGYTNVLWYRGGLEAWKRAGGQTVPAGG
ncbi:rhodanese-like domain-containing protein [Amaricoccus macauensis]|uniref:rhodanese-like domain-containing protein n=1 Tax=Amaricoccus macauensis TaxID=57001 RepID=UPI003C7A03D6